MVTLAGPLAMVRCEPRQARKGATVTIELCAGVWLVRVATLHSRCKSVLDCKLAGLLRSETLA